MLEFIKRNTPKILDCFTIKYIDSADGFDCYEIYTEDEKIVLAGNCKLSIAMAYYCYLNKYCGIIITNGDYDISTTGSAPLPKEKITYVIKQKIRARTSYEFFALEGNYWGFDRWEKEIDFMAMHGINTAYQPVGFDGVLYKFLCQLGMDEKLCLEFSSGPAFLMRQLTGNIAGTSSINSKDYLDRKIYIGKKINDRERELGIEPVFPAALPSVPFSLRKKYIKMDIFKAPQWYNFPPIFFIKSQSAFFEIFNDRFLKFQHEIMGETKSFFFEPLYDVNQKGFNTHLASMGERLSEILHNFDPEAICYTHTSAINESFFKEISGKKFIFIDDKGDKALVNGKNYITAVKGNIYGRTAIYGNINALCDCPFSNNPDSLGTALELDTFRENPLYCAAALKCVTASKPFDCDEFVKSYAVKRYKTDAYTEDLLRLKNLCYTSNESVGSIICARPTTKINHTAPHDTMERKYDFHELFAIVESMLNNEARKIDTLRADIQSILRQALSDFAYPIYFRATDFFREKNVGNFEQASNLFLEICEDIDRLLKTRTETNFSTKYEEAHALGDSKEEKEAIDINYLLLHTIWGPLDHSILYDTAWVEWGGLVKDYYAKRWFMYFRSLAAYFDNPKKLKDNSKKLVLDRNEYKGSYQLKRLAHFDNTFLEDYMPKKDGIGEEDTIEVAKELIQKYSEVIHQF